MFERQQRFLFVIWLGLFFLLSGPFWLAMIWLFASDLELNIDRRLWTIVGRTTLQAGLSSGISLVLGWALARSLFRQSHRRFVATAEGLLMRLASLAFVMPALAAIEAMLALYGRNGLVSLLFSQSPSTSWLFSLWGVVATHVFFNMPLAARLFLLAYKRLPLELWRQCRALGLSSLARGFWVELPLLAPSALAFLALVFLLCFTAFAVPLVFGGLTWQSLEVALYQALAFSYDLSRARALIILQLFSTLPLIFLVRALSRRTGTQNQTNGLPLFLASQRTQDRRPKAVWPEAKGRTACAFDMLLLFFAFAFLVLPCIALAWRSLNPAALLAILTSPRFYQAFTTSLGLALGSSLLALVMALCLASALRRARIARAPLFLLAYIPQALPPLAFSVSAFALLGLLEINPMQLGPFLVFFSNAMASLALATLLLEQALYLPRSQDRLAFHLGLGGWARWRYVEWPRLRPGLVWVMAFSAAFSLGDYSLIAFFGSESFLTLPALLREAQGHYRLSTASVIVLLMLGLIFLFFWLADRLGTARAN